MRRKKKLQIFGMIKMLFEHMACIWNHHENKKYLLFPIRVIHNLIQLYSSIKVNTNKHATWVDNEKEDQKEEITTKNETQTQAQQQQQYQQKQQ